MKLNIGCGRDYRPGWVNIDISSDCKTDVRMDIRTGTLPAREYEADEVYISGVLEQIGDNGQLIHVMNECHRVLKPGGKMVVVVPNAAASANGAATTPPPPPAVAPAGASRFVEFGDGRTWKLSCSAPALTDMPVPVPPGSSPPATT